MNGRGRIGRRERTGAPAAAVLPDGASPAGHRFAQRASIFLGRFPYRVRRHHVERVPLDGPVVLVANHSSYVDGPLLLGMLPRSSVFLIKHEVFRGPVGWFLRKIGQLPVRRGEPDRTPLLAAVRILREGGLVAVFPEGTRGQGDVLNAQHGAAWLARSSDAAVVPVAFRGTRRPANAPRRLFPRVDVLFGEPVMLPGTKGRTGLNAATEQVRSELVALIAELDRTLAGAGEDVPTTNQEGNQA